MINLSDSVYCGGGGMFSVNVSQWGLGSFKNMLLKNNGHLQCVPRKGFGSAVCVHRDR